MGLGWAVPRLVLVSSAEAKPVVYLEPRDPWAMLSESLCLLSPLLPVPTATQAGDRWIL